MDSLIVLRRPLRKPQVEPKFIIPKKSKKAQTKMAPIPPSLHSAEPPISFVKLYKEVCVENARHSPPHANLSDSEYENVPTRVHSSQPSRENLHRPSRSQLSAEWPLAALAARGHVNSPASCSDASLVTQYCAPRAGRRLRCHPPPFGAARAELILELDYEYYDTTHKDSGFF